jgi:quinol monooxygenase YgiN
MVIEYIRYRIPEDQRERFEAAYGEAQRPLQASPHCLAYELSRCVEEPACYVLRIEWDSVEGHMEGFRRSEEFREFFQHIRPFVGQIEEMRHYEATSVASTSASGK